MPYYRHTGLILTLASSQSTKTQKKRTRPISSHFDWKSLVNKGFIIWPKDYTKVFYFCRNKVRNPEQSRKAHLARSDSQSEHRIRFILPARGASHIMKLLKDSRMFHILWCSSGYNYFIIFISILNVLNLASKKLLLFNICICIIEQLFPVGQRREMRFRIYSYRNAGNGSFIDLKMFMKAKYHFHVEIQIRSQVYNLPRFN